MKTKNSIFKIIIALTFAVFIISGCKKNTTPNPTPVTPADGPTQQTQRASDQSNVENESKRAMDDANSAMGDVSTTRAVQAYCNVTIDSSCNVTIDSSQKAIGRIILIYNGLDCYGTTNRTGSITIQLPYSPAVGITRWSTAGSIATLTYNNYKVTYLYNNKSLTFNGTHTVTNVSGGGLIQLYFGNSIVHKIRGDMQLTFDDGTIRNWEVAELQTFTYANNIVKASVTGDTALSGHSNVAYWGTNRIGESFIVEMPTAFSYDVYGSGCLYRPLTGGLVFYGVAHQLTLTYGVDQSGAIVTSGCPYGYKLSWTDAQGAAQQIVLSY